MNGERGLGREHGLGGEHGQPCELNLLLPCGSAALRCRFSPVFMRNQESGIMGEILFFVCFSFFLFGIAGSLLLCAGLFSLVVVSGACSLLQCVGLS